MRDEYIVEKLNTANILYSYPDNEIYFVDFLPRGIWNDKKEEVFRLFKEKYDVFKLK